MYMYMYMYIHTTVHVYAVLLCFIDLACFFISSYFNSH